MKSLAEWAALYRSKGWNCLPNRINGTRRYPPFHYAHARDDGLSERSFGELAGRFGCDGIQVALGPRWGLCVLDCDGPLSGFALGALAAGRPLPRTWCVEHTPRSGRHYWFTLKPGQHVERVRVVWRMESRKHSLIELLGAGNLIVAPPSTSARTGNPYRFLVGPDDLPEPAPLPRWLLDLPGVDVRPAPAPSRRQVEFPPTETRTGGRHYRSAEVIAAIGDPVPLLRSWGLRVVDDTPNAAGWMRCRALGREDRSPSAMVSIRGRYWEPSLPKPLGVFDVAVELGLYPDAISAIDDLGRRYVGQPRASA